MTPDRTLACWCPDWPIAAASRSEHDAVAVVANNQVVACSAAARSFGVKRGQRRREAQSRCSDLLVLPHDPDGEARAYEPVVAVLDDICPRVEVIRPGLCVFATRGPSRYFGGDHALAAKVMGIISETAGTPCHVGVANGAFAAIVAARASHHLSSSGDGLPSSGDGAESAPLLVPERETAAFLAPFPVRVLDRPELANLLRRLGIRTLGDFARLPPDRVLARFGPDGATAHRLARGLDDRLLVPRAQPLDLRAAIELDPPVERADAAAFAVKTLADGLHADLQSKGLACRRIVIVAETEHGERMERVWRHDGALTAAAIAERVRWQIDGWLQMDWSHRPTAGITRLQLQPEELHPDTGRQHGLWGGSTAADERAAGALARVQRLVGLEGVVLAVRCGGRSPGEQVELVPWGDARTPSRLPPSSGKAESPAWPGTLPSPAPAIVYDPPEPVDVTDDHGEPVVVTGRALCRSAPARLSIRGQRPVAIRLWAGPWPVDERWWDPAARQRRARFQVVTAEGAAHLLSVEGGGWWLDASYD